MANLISDEAIPSRIPRPLRIITLDEVPEIINRDNISHIIIGLGEGSSPVAPYAQDVDATKISIDYLYKPKNVTILERSPRIQAALDHDPNWYPCYGNLYNLYLPDSPKISAFLAFFPDNEWQYLVGLQKRFPSAYFLVVTPIYSESYREELKLTDEEEMGISIYKAFLDINPKTSIEYITPEEYANMYPATTWSQIISQSEPDYIEGIAIIEVNIDRRISFEKGKDGTTVGSGDEE